MPVAKPILRKSYSPAFRFPVDLLIMGSYTFKWLFISIIVGVLAGSASAFFLISLDRVTGWREDHSWILWFLPVAGLAIGLMYHYFGKEVVKGNNQLIEEIQNPRRVVPLIMVPLVYLGTIITHLGGSAGREGTAVQMGGAFADQLTRVLRLRPRDRKILIICGMSAGFSSVFGTPLAGAVFGLEVLMIGSMMYGAILPSFLAAVIADLTCRAWGATHATFLVGAIPDVSGLSLLLCILGGVVFGATARSFSSITHRITAVFARYISYPPFRPFLGGIVLVILVFVIGNTRYVGLGVPVIQASFTEPQIWYDFLLKILLTALTLGSGFKGGEVTPLFFIGATLGSVLSMVVPLPVGLVAGMGMTAVFAAAANTPIACIFLGIELFGAESAVYIAVTSVVAYLFSGHHGIYRSQVIGHSKHAFFRRQEGHSLSMIQDEKKGLNKGS